MALFLGVDIGTSGARALAVDERGVVVAQAAMPYGVSSPRPGWTEQDPNTWWRGADDVLRAVAREVGEQVVAIGLTGQMHGSVFLDAADRPIRPALLWNDQRTAAQCREIGERVGIERLISLTGNPALTGFQAPKILWLRREEPENYARVAHVLLPKDYVRLWLTGEYATDASDASGTLLLDVRRRNWSPEILAALEIPEHWLPPVYEGPEVTGRLLPDIATDLGLPPGIPVVAGGGDNAAAAVGAGIISQGRLSSSVGTSGVLFAPMDIFTPDASGRIHAFCHAVPARYHLMAVTLAAGGSLSWWRDILAPEMSFADLVDGAEDVPVGAEGLLFLPYLSGERTPHLDPQARGAFIGLTGRHTAAHLTRAVMEGVVFSLRDGLEIMRDLGVPIEGIRLTGGGARSALWRRLQTDIYGVPVYRSGVEEGPAYGAALLAAVGAGYFRDVEELCAAIERPTEVTEPDPGRASEYGELYAVFRTLYSATREAMWSLGRFA